MFIELVNKSTKKIEAISLSDIAKIRADTEVLTIVTYKESVKAHHDTFIINYDDLLKKLNDYFAPIVTITNKVGPVEHTETKPYTKELEDLKEQLKILQDDETIMCDGLNSVMLAHNLEMVDDETYADMFARVLEELTKQIADLILADTNKKEPTATKFKKR